MPLAYDDLLHPLIREVAAKHLEHGSYRNAVLDAVTGLFDMLRARTGLDVDGDRLCNDAFSPNRPKLIFSNLESESGFSDQVGFMEIFKGVYRGVRNPKAHSLTHDLNEVKTGQYLVMLSLLARRLEEASPVDLPARASSEVQDDLPTDVP